MSEALTSTKSLPSYKDSKSIFKDLAPDSPMMKSAGKFMGTLKKVGDFFADNKKEELDSIANKVANTTTANNKNTDKEGNNTFTPDELSDIEFIIKKIMALSLNLKASLIHKIFLLHNNKERLNDFEGKRQTNHTLVD